MDTNELRRRVDALGSEPDRLRRRLLALGALTARLAGEGIEPILVGGCALEVYTDGGYSTGDVDLALTASSEAEAAFSDLGFEKRGRFWIRAELDLVFEAPAPAGLPGETAPRTELEIEGLRIVVLGVEDLLIDRLRAWCTREERRRRSLGDEAGRAVRGRAELELSSFHGPEPSRRSRRPRAPRTGSPMKSWEEFREALRRRKQERWISILLSEPRGRPSGRRPRDPEQEKILAELDRRRIERNELLASARRVPVED